MTNIRRRLRRLRHRFIHRNDVYVTALEYLAYVKAVMPERLNSIGPGAGVTGSPAAFGAGWFHKDSAAARFALIKREIDASKEGRLP